MARQKESQRKVKELKLECLLPIKGIAYSQITRNEMP
jgi:hypothetical protein